MDIRVLRYFLKICELGNISKAAESLHTTQPNLSRQLTQLEEELGRTLVIRGKRRPTLTEEGGISESKRSLSWRWLTTPSRP